MNQKEHIIKEYEDKKVVDTFDAERSKYAYQRFKHKKESAVLRNAIKSCDGEKVKVLDIACGTGRMIPPAHACNKLVDYYGIDSSKTMLDSVREWFYTPSKLIQGDATKLPFEDNTFDVVFTFHLLWHLPGDVQLKIIKEMRRVCKKGGLVVMDLINEDFVWGQDTEGIYKWSEFSSFPKAKIDKLNDFPFKNSFVYYIFNIMNYFDKVLPINLFHMIYLTIKK